MRLNKMKNFSSIRALVLVALALLVCSGQLIAQSATTGAITGRVVDPQGAVVPNATVKITNLGDQNEKTATSSDEGTFNFPNLQPGTYRLDVNATGFAAGSVAQVVVEVGRSTPIDFPLSITGQVANVTVTAEAPVINTEDNANATNITQTEITELPINGRRASDFARLTPGVNPEGEFGLNSFRGLSSLLNNHQLDGTDNNNTFFSEERGRTRIQYSVSQAAVREFQVNNTNFS
ncbi:MAG TPA: carboxypeptidase-like regulatory domain-containing protein, partial [Pyrinomonadaceae bacterium]|nr:carboxypeptidase-like regulatory domain-containing protein [Pyrinomonadaceae bacterium]